ncbi:MAG: sulfotransferase [Solirubrobacteraceae bacterium]
MIASVDSPSVKVIYVGGYARSGSTLLGRVLGEPQGMVCVGETRFLWSRGLINNVGCGCGQPFRSCPFWTAVGEEAFGGWDQVNAEEMTELDRVTNLPQALPLYWAPWLRPGMDDKISEYVAILSKLYAAIKRVSGAEVIIEISKDPTLACLLRRMPDSDVRVIHLVRDSRAVAYSWTRKRRMPSPIGNEEFMSRASPTETAIKWSAWNVGCYALRAARFPYQKVTYENFVADPRATLDKLSVFADEEIISSGSELRGNEVKLGDHHIFSGNPMRATTGWLPVRLDTEWQTQLPKAQFAKVTAITFPLLRVNGYPLMPAARRSGKAAVPAPPPS